MGKLRKGYNWKARQIVNTSIKESKSSKVEVKFDNERNDKYDESNALVLPSKKRETKLSKPVSKPAAKVLSKKQRKRLEKIVERKKKKENRSSLLDALSKVQVPEDVLNQMTSITEVQTRGVKRLREMDNDSHAANLLENVKKKIVINGIKGWKRKHLLANGSQPVESVKDPNIVGFELSDEESESENVDEDDEATKFLEQNIDDKNNQIINASGGVDSDCSIMSEPVNMDSRTDEKIKNSDIVSDLTINSTLDAEETQINHCYVKEIFKNKWTVTDCERTKVNRPNLNDSNLKIGVNNLEKRPAESKPAVFVPVNRKPEIQEARLKLPILGEEQAIMEAISENPIVIIAGETGSGKTTQIPQFLYEAGYSLGGRMIGVTEPRRVAAISMSQRVGEELNLSSDIVSYLIRFEGNVTPNTQIKFMTDGVLLKEIQTDFLLTKYSVIILDEAHERSVYTDILIGFLSRIVPVRQKRNSPLKLIIMSATLRLSDFTENKRLFKVTPPVIKVESRQYPVSIHFNKRTNPDYVREAYRKACKIHTQLPEGGILIFVTGQQEVNILVRKLQSAFPLRKQSLKNSEGNKEEDSYENKENDDVEMLLENTLRKKRRLKKKETQICLPNIDLNKYPLVANDDTEADAMDNDGNSDNGLDDDDSDDDEFLSGHNSSQPLWVLPLYSLLPNYKQAKVFKPPPEGCRLCVVATNIAETSLTIPHVKYVVDSGKVKTKVYDKLTGVSAFTVVWTSKAAANQRAGRAGRMGPGHCYRLYSSAVFNDEFQQWSVPEIQKQPVDDLVLQLKAIGIKKVSNFPFPSSPDMVQLNAAGRRLSILGALSPLSSNSKEENWNGRLTKLGEAMSVFPVLPRFAKMLCLSHQDNLMAYTVTIVSALSVQELLLIGDKEWAKTRRKWAGAGNFFLLGDLMVLLRAVGASEYANSNGNLEKFCEQNGLRLKAVLEVRKLRLHLTKEINLHAPDLNLIVDPRMPPPTDQQAKQLRQIVLSGLVDQVAKRVPDEEAQEAGIKKGKAVYRTIEMEDFVYIHPNSVLYKEQPEWVVYQQVSEMSKLYIIGLTVIEPQWLPIFAPSLCKLTPLTEPSPRYDKESGTPYCVVSGTFGRGGWTLPSTEMEFPSCLDKYKWFGVFILDGSVCPKLEKYTKGLLSKPSAMIRVWSNLVPRTTLLVKELVDKEVDSRSKLLDRWSNDSKYLLSAYLAWLPESIHNEVISIWPPLDH